MRALVLWLCAACACTQDFTQFDPTDGAVVDTATDQGGPDGVAPEAGPDAPVDAPAETGPVDAAPDVTVACTESGAIMYGGHCYFLVTTQDTFANSSTTCTNAGAHLVTITTSGEQAAVIALGSGTERWTGLQKTAAPQKDSSYTWITNESRNNYSAWSPGEPTGTGACGKLLAGGLWAAQDCATTLACICERQ
jgi:hypothetical protein